MASTVIPPPMPLESTGDAYQNWIIWKSEFTLFSTATGLRKQPKEVQAATLLVKIGQEGTRVFYTFKFANDDEKQDLDKLIEKFKAHYKPAKNLTFNEFRFGSRDQREGESCNKWLIDIRTLAHLCGFGELEDRLLRSRIIPGVRDKDLQQKLLSENPSYAKTVEIGRAREQAKEHFNEIREAEVSAIDETTVHAVK
ncbi:uncharacterized protein LOC142570274 [Dermacentor variabilis]|uniref:uncharacterized protein LOC142570274 n=1 Tax=Dermacentor variabilis TaxID=34621 RepID=UPI003F5C7DA2